VSVWSMAAMAGFLLHDGTCTTINAPAGAVF